MKQQNSDRIEEDDLLPEYQFDYSKSKPNKYAASNRILIELDPDIAEVFKNADEVNKALRLLIQAYPRSQRE